MHRTPQPSYPLRPVGAGVIKSEASICIRLRRGRLSLDSDQMDVRRRGPSTTHLTFDIRVQVVR
jgi:hypothetical protein